MDLRIILTIAILIVALIALLARFVGPNIFIGFRIGYTVIDDRVWKKTHEFCVMIFIAAAVIFYLLTMYLKDLLSMIALFISIMLISTIITLFKSVEYAEKITGFEPTTIKEIKPLEPLKAEHANLISYLLFVIFLLIFTYSTITLPQIVAVRFDLSGKPVAWQDKFSFLVSMLILASSITIVVKAVTYIGARHPIVFYSGLIARKWGKRALFLLTIYSLQITEIIIALTLLVITLYNLPNLEIPAIPTLPLIALLIIISIFPILLLYHKRTKETISS